MEGNSTGERERESSCDASQQEETVISVSDKLDLGIDASAGLLNAKIRRAVSIHGQMQSAPERPALIHGAPREIYAGNHRLLWLRYTRARKREAPGEKKGSGIN